METSMERFKRTCLKSFCWLEKLLLVNQLAKEQDSAGVLNSQP